MADLGLMPKKTFSYLFDFGDSWMHELTVERIDAADSGTYPRLVASEGDAPVQYPLPDEEGYDEEDDWLGAWGDEGADAADFDPVIDSPFCLFPHTAIEGILEALGIEAPNYNDLSKFDLPMPNGSLRRLPIDLNILVPAFELIPPGPIYLDTERGDLVIVPPGDAPEFRILRETIEGAPERYLRVPEATGERQLAAMVEYTDSLPDGRLKTRLQAAFAHPNGFDRWYRVLERDPVVADRWHDAADRRVVADALAWLAEHGIAPIPPVGSNPTPESDAIEPAEDSHRPVPRSSKPRPKMRRR